MEGFPAHRDACEWVKMRALFAEQDAYVFTTWSGGVPIDEFIKAREAMIVQWMRVLMLPYRSRKLASVKASRLL